MENYFSFNLKALTAVGVKLESSNGRLGKTLLWLTAVFILLTMTQNILTLASIDGFSFIVANAISIGLCSFTAMVKLLIVLRNRQCLTEIKKKLSWRLEEILKAEDEFVQVTKKLKVLSSIVNGLLVTTVCCSSIFNLLPGINFLVTFFTQDVPVEVLSFAFWYPFKKENHFLKVYFYEIVCVHFCTFTAQALDGLLLLLLGQAIACFDSLAMRLHKSIEEAAKHPTLRIVKINEIVDSHVELLELTQKLIEIFEVPMFANVVYQTGLICFTEFIITVGHFTLKRYNLRLN